MKTLKNLVKTETLNVEELLKIKGATSAPMGCGSQACHKTACSTMGCGSRTCDSMACSSKSCSGSTCTSGACGGLETSALPDIFTEITDILIV